MVVPNQLRIGFTHLSDTLFVISTEANAFGAMKGDSLLGYLDA